MALLRDQGVVSRKDAGHMSTKVKIFVETVNYQPWIDNQPLLRKRKLLRVCLEFTFFKQTGSQVVDPSCTYCIHPCLPITPVLPRGLASTTLGNTYLEQVIFLSKI